MEHMGVFLLICALVILTFGIGLGVLIWWGVSKAVGL